MSSTSDKGHLLSSPDGVPGRVAPGDDDLVAGRHRKGSGGAVPRPVGTRGGQRPLLVLLLVVAVLGGALVATLAMRDSSRPSETTGVAPGEVTPEQPSPGPEPSGQLSNGCVLNARGVPLCGALVGAAYGSNTDPTAWERQLGRRLGVHRTYYAPDKVSQAVADAKADVRAGRVPWISFKLPYSWRQMAAGRGDAWVTDVAGRLAEVKGPVWLAFHHEPENDGPMADWTRMQQRLAPLVRRTAPNVAYTIILTGWNQVYGPPWLALDAVWPRDVPIDLVGFDVYNNYGVVRDGQEDTTATRLADEYFVHFQAFSKSHGVPWAISETGITDSYAQRDPRWFQRTYRDLLRHDGVALTYFNSRLNSVADWTLTGTKEQDFARTLSRSPTLHLRTRPVS